MFDLDLRNAQDFSAMMNIPVLQVTRPLSHSLATANFQQATIGMTRSITTKPIKAAEAPARKGTIYPQEFANAVMGRSKAKLGDLFGLSNFGVNYTTIEPGSSSALLHYHQTQDEFVYVLEGEATLYRHRCSTDTTKSLKSTGEDDEAPQGEE